MKEGDALVPPEGSLFKGVSSCLEAVGASQSGILNRLKPKRILEPRLLCRALGVGRVRLPWKVSAPISVSKYGHASWLLGGRGLSISEGKATLIYGTYIPGS